MSRYSTLSCLLRTIYFTHEDLENQAHDECLTILDKNQTVEMSQRASELRRVAFEIKRRFSFFALRKKQM